ncbi:hypothetical protein C5612_21195 [Pseudomonas frederiksbergensis]|uniref:Uncharacterized protein n=1 Tax=Pseudomonas frederiksbergensis TaxID=104087 RepID=A0A2S8HFY8_9PSED|nr:hypothetical protein C5612_21195 [Pseudomonas frederiksbergensis]
MGAGLLAKSVSQSTSLVNVRPYSRASPLPHWVYGEPIKRPRNREAFYLGFNLFNSVASVPEKVRT